MSDLTVHLKKPISKSDVQSIAGVVPDNPLLQLYDESGSLQIVRSQDRSVLLDFIPNRNGSFSTIQCYMAPNEFKQFMDELRNLDKKLYRTIKDAFDGTAYAITRKDEIYAEAQHRMKTTDMDEAIDSWNDKLMKRIDALAERYDAANGDLMKMKKRDGKKIGAAMMEVPDAIIAQHTNTLAQTLYTNGDQDQISPAERAQLKAILTEEDIQAMMHADPKFAKIIRDVVVELGKCGDQSEDRSLQHKLHKANNHFQKATGESLIR